MIAESTSLQIEPPARPVCVVGAGCAGIALAVELTRTGVPCFLLEGGGVEFEAASQETLVEGAIDGEHDPLAFSRQKRFGGTSEQWGGRCTPLDALDFAARPEIGRPGWPLAHTSLDDHYRRAQRTCDAGDFTYRADQALSHAAPYVNGDRASELEDDKLWRWSPPMRFGRRYRRLLAESSTTLVVLHANIVRLERCSDTGRILAAVALAPSGRELRFQADSFVLAVGGIEVARLLLASNDVSPEGIGNEHDLLGRFYMTHPTAEIARVTFGDRARASAGGILKAKDGTYCRRILSIAPEVLTREAIPNASFALWYPDPLNPEHRDPLLSSYALARYGIARSGRHWKSTGAHRRYSEMDTVLPHAANILRGAPSAGVFAARFAVQRWIRSRSIPSFMTIPSSGSLRLRVDIEQLPHRDNRITLSSQRDANGMPRVDIRYAIGDQERETVVRSLAVIRREFERLRIGEVELPDEASKIAFFGMGAHQMGMTRMGASPQSGVVDSACRVFGTGNLYIASSSVFPSGGAVGPTLTVVALAIRIADLLIAESRSIRVTQATPESSQGLGADRVMP